MEKQPKEPRRRTGSAALMLGIVAGFALLIGLALSRGLLSFDRSVLFGFGLTIAVALGLLVTRR